MSKSQLKNNKALCHGQRVFSVTCPCQAPDQWHAGSSVINVLTILSTTAWFRSHNPLLHGYSTAVLHSTTLFNSHISWKAKLENSVELLERNLLGAPGPSAKHMINMLAIIVPVRLSRNVRALVSLVSASNR